MIDFTHCTIFFPSPLHRVSRALRWDRHGERIITRPCPMYKHQRDPGVLWPPRPFIGLALIPRTESRRVAINFPIAMVLLSGAASELLQFAKTMSAEPCAIQSWVGLLTVSFSDLVARALFGVDGPPNSRRGEP